MQEFRTRKNGQHYPVTPRGNFAKNQPVFSPAQLLQRYEQSSNPTEKAKLKRAAVSMANKTHDHEWENVTAKMSTQLNNIKNSNDNFPLKTKLHDKNQVVSEKSFSTLNKTLSKIPPEHLNGLKIVWYDDLNIHDMYFGKGPHGEYNINTDEIRIRDTQGLKPRTISHEIGHRVYNKKLTTHEKEKWLKVSDEIHYHEDLMYDKNRAEEVFAELYSEYTTNNKPLIMLKYQPINVQKTFKEIMHIE